MAQKLTNLSIQALTRLGYHADPQVRGLYLQVTRWKNQIAKSWIFRYTSPLTGKRREMGLGPLSLCPLSSARLIAQQNLQFIQTGLDPIEERQRQLQENRLARLSHRTVEEVSRECIAAKSPEWKNKKHTQQWITTLETYIFPTLGQLPINKLTTQALYGVFKDIWLTKHETASRTRQRIEVIWNWAKAHGYCEGENPARLKGALGDLLPKGQKVKKVAHFAALPFREIPAFIGKLRVKAGVAPLGLEFLILTAARTGEVLGARWEEMDLESRTWTIPPGRMKAGKEHRIPLNERAMAILQAQLAVKSGEYVFPSPSTLHKPLSNGAFLSVLHKMAGYEGITPHGFRSTFRDWAAETTHYANETLELALAHQIKNQAEAAYRREDQLAKRAKLMQQWQDYLEHSREENIYPFARENLG